MARGNTQLSPAPRSCTDPALHPAPPRAGWTLTSISGFSQAFARAVDSAVAIRSSTGGGGGAAGGAAHRPPPAHLGHGLTQGVASLAEGVAAGLTGMVRAPLQGYSSGSGVLGGLGRGLLGAVGLPVRWVGVRVGGWVRPAAAFRAHIWRRGRSSAGLHARGVLSQAAGSQASYTRTIQTRCCPRLPRALSARSPLGSGALELVGAVSAGLASSAGVVHVPQPRREGRLMLTAEPPPSGGTAADAAAPGEEARPAPAALVPVVVGAARLMQHPALLAHTLTSAGADGGGGGLGPGRYLAHAPLLAASVLQGAAGLQGADWARGAPLLQPVLLVASGGAVLFARGGLEVALVLPLSATGGPLRHG